MRRLEGIKLAIRDTTRRFDLCGREPMFSTSRGRWKVNGWEETLERSDFVVIGLSLSLFLFENEAIMESGIFRDFSLTFDVPNCRNRK